MTISKTSRLLKFAMWPDHNSYFCPPPISLCALFWRCIFRILGIGVIVGLASFLGWAIWNDPWGFILVFGTMFGGIVILAAAIATGEYAKSHRLFPADGLVATTLWGIKNKVCPLINIED